MQASTPLGLYRKHYSKNLMRIGNCTRLAFHLTPDLPKSNHRAAPDRDRRPWNKEKATTPPPRGTITPLKASSQPARRRFYLSRLNVLRDQDTMFSLTNHRQKISSELNGPAFNAVNHASILTQEGGGATAGRGKLKAVDGYASTRGLMSPSESRMKKQLQDMQEQLSTKQLENFRRDLDSYMETYWRNPSSIPKDYREAISDFIDLRTDVDPQRMSIEDQAEFKIVLEHAMIAIHTLEIKLTGSVTGFKNALDTVKSTFDRVANAMPKRVSYDYYTALGDLYAMAGEVDTATDCHLEADGYKGENDPVNPKLFGTSARPRPLLEGFNAQKVDEKELEEDTKLLAAFKDKSASVYMGHVVNPGSNSANMRFTLSRLLAD